MNQYHIRIDGVQPTNSYTYQELVDMGIFELDANGIEVKKTTESIFAPLKSYNFPEQQAYKCTYHIDEYGQIHKETSTQNNDHNGAYVDEFGQIIRPNRTEDSSATPSSSTNSSSTNDSSNESGWATFFRIIATIAIIGAVIAFVVSTGGIAAPLAYVAFKAICSIWDN